MDLQKGIKKGSLYLACNDRKAFFTSSDQSWYTLWSCQKVQVGTSRQRSGKGAIRKRFPLQKPRLEKTKLTIRYLYHETYRKPNEQLFPNRWPLSYLNLTKNMKTYIRRQQHKQIFKHQDIKQKEPPQKYRLATISNTKLLAGLNRFYMAITSPSASAVVHNIYFFGPRGESLTSQAARQWRSLGAE